MKSWLSLGTERITDWRIPNRLTRYARSLIVGQLLLSLSLALPLTQALATNEQTYMPVNQPAAEISSLQGLRIPKERNKKSLNQLYEFDRLPLGNRIPVILVPGRAEEFQHDSWWKRFHTVASKNEPFHQHYKLYVFLYNSKEELADQAGSLAIDLKKRFGKLPKCQPLMLVAYSLGGVMAREILKDTDLLSQMDTMFAISVPFHGSPIFEPAWFSEFLNTPTQSPVRRFWDRSFYRAYMFDKSNLTRGMGWDNFDSSKPQFHVDNTPHVIGDQINGVIPAFEEYENANLIRGKTIVYASYLENSFTESKTNPHLPWYAGTNVFTFFAAALPLYGFTVHSVFRYTNYQLANLATYTTEDPQGRNTNLYLYNDGAIPLSSMLFLPPSLEPYAGGVDELVQKTTVKKARIFLNIDHVDMGEYNVNKRKLIRPDMLHPKEEPRSPNQWIIDDLNTRYTELYLQNTPATSTKH